jgi:hypothetical protein
MRGKVRVLAPATAEADERLTSPLLLNAHFLLRPADLHFLGRRQERDDEDADHREHQPGQEALDGTSLRLPMPSPISAVTMNKATSPAILPRPLLIRSYPQHELASW